MCRQLAAIFSRQLYKTKKTRMLNDVNFLIKKIIYNVKNLYIYVYVYTYILLDKTFMLPIMYINAVI